ncbi:hypothetical protein KFK09_026409 [Dendrobium nobile]|uniref:Reverse transcriptase domain-containing protein n=1 Tax=Dendrobium nobile TaxID=94219 RepID=A0A8T3A7Q6_DENNO|nr:hypothetical protein KFK09_026409 [Dendrobium nobile]
MADVRPSGGSLGVVIREGLALVRRQEFVEGKGKKVIEDVCEVQKEGDVQCIPDLGKSDFSGSNNISLRVKSSSGVLGSLSGRTLENEINPEGGQKNDNLAPRSNYSERNVIGEVSDAWMKIKLIKILFNKEQIDFSKDGVAVILNADKEAENSKTLKNSIVIKVLGNNVTFLVSSVELRRQWSKYGSFHLTSLGMNWILCSFKSSEVVDEILNGGPWYVNGCIVGMDKWMPEFDLNSFKGISAPIWIRLPNLPLYCWDEDNIARIASCIGSPLYLDGNTFRWSKREFARVCVKIDLEKKLPNGVWVEGSAGRFFQRVEYEKVDLLCYQCGKVGHESKISPDNVKIGIQDQSKKKAVKDTGENLQPDAVFNNSITNNEYGHWIQVQFKNRRFRRNVMAGRGGKVNGVIEEHRDTSNQQVVSVETITNENEKGSNKIKDLTELAEKTPMQPPIIMVVSTAVAEKCETTTNNRFAALSEKAMDENKVAIAEEGITVDENGTVTAVEEKCNALGSQTSLAKVKGAKKREASLYLKEVVKEHGVFFVGLMETKLSSINRKEVDYLIGSEWEFFHYSAVGISGGILVLWNSKLVSFNVLEATSQKIPVAVTKHLMRMASDHCPIVLKMDEKVQFNSKNIRFEDTWRSYPASKSIVFHSWNKKDSGDEAVILQRKLNRTLKALFFWNKNKCRDLNALKEKLKQEIMELQNKEALGVNWECITADWPAILDSQKISEEDITFLSAEFLVLELQNSVFQQENNKSPGLDGVTYSFYKIYWSIVGETLWKAVNSFFNSYQMHKEWKKTLIVLIPKIKSPLTPSNYRPISLCQTNYKIVATMLVNRLKKIISKLISEEQVAFVHGRSIADHCLLAQEVFHKFKISKNKKGLMAIKLDMEQAYDNMSWTSLWYVLEWYGFPIVFSKLLMECVVDVSFSIIINGKNSSWIDAHSGFRQGCPLSPYLFILCAQLLSNSIMQRGQKIGIQISPRGPVVTHLLYADDVLILSNANVELAKKMKNIVEDFCKWTGQKVNVNKSQLMFGKAVKNSMKKKIARVLGFKVVKDMKYLGIKITLNRVKIANFQDILCNVTDKLNAWNKKSLSLGGKLILIDSSLLSMPNFLVTHSMVPKRVLFELEKLCRNFLWHKKEESKGMHYVAWKDICKPRCYGGLGIHSPLDRIGSLRSKLAWNFIQKPQSLLHRVMAARYGNDVMNGGQRKINSTAWKILVDGGKYLKMAVRWSIGKGDKVNVLNDTWILDRCFSRWPTFIDCNALEGIYVQHFILNNGIWDYEKLQIFFNPDLIHLISQVHIDFEGEDQLELMKKCSGKTVSALVYEQTLINRFNMEDTDFCSWLQKLKLKKKVEVFWWRIWKAAIPTNLFLKIRNIASDDSCPRVYHSWKNRNNVKHGKCALPSSVVAANALFTATSNSGPHLSCWGANLPRESQSTWCPPPKDWIKINVDASLLRSNLAAVGGILRDHKGRLISAFGKTGSHWDSAQLELEAVFSIREFLKSWMLECKGLIIESDNANVIKFIQDSLKKGERLIKEECDPLAKV